MNHTEAMTQYRKTRKDVFAIANSEMTDAAKLVFLGSLEDAIRQIRENISFKLAANPSPENLAISVLCAPAARGRRFARISELVNPGQSVTSHFATPQTNGVKPKNKIVADFFGSATTAVAR